MSGTSQRFDYEKAAEVSQLHENFLSQLEGLTISAIITGNWSEVHNHIDDFRASQEAEETTSTEDPLEDLWNLVFQKESNA